MLAAVKNKGAANAIGKNTRGKPMTSPALIDAWNSQVSTEKAGNK
jgi:hypothetical protein